jgi:NAD+ diphosphatase
MCAQSFSLFKRITSDSTFAPKTVAPQEVTDDGVWFLFQGDRLVIAQDQDDVLPLPALPEELGLQPFRRQYLGCWGEGDAALHCFAGELAEDLTLPAGLAAVDLRSLFGVWEDRWIGMAGRAKQVAHWDRDHQFCGRCGAPTELAAGERARRCPRCRLTSYPRISPAIIIAVTRWTEAGEQILLARNHRFPAGRYSVVAGFVEAGETLEECAMREVQEEVGIRIANIRYFGSQPWPFPNSLMIGFTADYAGGSINLEDSEIADAQWFSTANLPQLPPKISIARRLIDSYVQRQPQQPVLRDW